MSLNVDHYASGIVNAGSVQQCSSPEVDGVDLISNLQPHGGGSLIFFGDFSVKWISGVDEQYIKLLDWWR